MRNILFLISILFLSSCNNSQINTCTIKGQLIGYDNCKTLILIKSHLDPRYSGERITLNENNEFEFTIEKPTNELYSLMSDEVFSGATVYPINFFPEEELIEFEIYSMDRLSDNKIKGSKLSNLLLNFEIEEKNWLDANPFQPSNNDSVFEAFIERKVRFTELNHNLAGYSMLVRLLPMARHDDFIDYNNLLSIGRSFQNTYPNHPYTEYINSYMEVAVGNQCPSFKAPNARDEIVELQNIIEANKLTLVDLWSPWCGPCIRKSQDILPIYAKYANSGFEVIAVVGGINDEESYHEALQKHNYPWENLKEINNQNGIWEAFNIMNSGGATFLINNAGTLLAINPSKEEIVDYINANI